MAYLVNKEHICHTEGCRNRGTEELFTKYDNSRGFYCHRHASGALRRLEVAEVQAFLQTVQAESAKAIGRDGMDA